MESKHNNLRLPDAFVHLLQSDDLKYDLGSNQGKFISQNVEGKDLIADFLNYLFIYAKTIKASDIHFQHRENGCMIRFRLQNTQLQDYRLISRSSAREINTRLRAQGNLTEMENQRGLDSAFFLIDELDNKLLSSRITFIPTAFGQNIVCRLLGSADELPLSDIEMPEYIREEYLKVIRKSKGLIVNSGPTGSGKTKTLAATIDYLNDGSLNIMTVEDPPEIIIPGANQVSVSTHLRFADAVRHFMRQDPDIIMVGEVRDMETALAATNAAYTGHLVFFTVHAPDAAKTVLRLIQLGADPYALAHALLCFYSQRLLPKLCPNCCKMMKGDAAVISRFNFSHYYQANEKGCQCCSYTGYKGRIPVFEMAFNNEQITEGILNANLEQITHALMQQTTYRTLTEAALELSADGKVDYYHATTLE